MKQKRWYKLDNSGKIFPPITNEYDTCVFRISCTLKETINGPMLQKALEKTLVDFPVFNSVLKRGFFWYYIESVSNTKKVSPECQPICDNIRGILYRVTYFQNRINLEVSHALTDGYGATVFLRCLVANYLKATHNIETEEEIDIASTYEKSEDAFKKYYKKFKKHKSNIFKKSYKVKGNVYDDYRLKIIETTSDLDKSLALAKENNCTITEFLTAILLKSILSTMTERDKTKPIYITIPVSLRKEFPTYTTRNFFCTMEIAYKHKGNDELSEIIDEIKNQFKNELQRENLYSKMSEMIFLESFFICRIVPRVIKDFVLRTSYKITRRTHTMTLSNIGRITMPKVYEEYIDNFCFHSSTDGIQLNIISFENKMKMSFSSHFVNSEIQKEFIRQLNKMGVEFVVDTNILENENDKM